MTPGQVAYEAYRADAGGHSLATGDELPEWPLIPRRTQQCWESAAAAVRRWIIGEGG
jgi:hypothetical protein